MLQELRADSAAFQVQAEKALVLSQESRAPYYQQWAQILVEFASACNQPSADHLARIEDAINNFTATGARIRLPYYLSLLARAYRQAGKNEKALEVISQAIREASNSQERCWDADLHRLRAEFLLAQEGLIPVTAGAVEAQRVIDGSISTETLAFAEGELSRSLEIARIQGATVYELRASVSLARIRQAQHRTPLVKELLIPVLNRLEEGRDTADVQAAQFILQLPE
jgi:predicted ATPase